MGNTCKRVRDTWGPLSDPRFDVDGLPLEILATDEPGRVAVVTEPREAPVVYTFERLSPVDMACVDIAEGLSPRDLDGMPLLSPGATPKVGTDLGDALWAMMMGLVGAAKLAGRPLDEGFGHDAPKPKRRAAPRGRSIRY